MHSLLSFVRNTGNADASDVLQIYNGRGRIWE